PKLAKQVIAVYKEDDRGKYLDNLFRLQLIAGDYENALATIRSLRAVLRSSDPVWAHIAYIHYEIYAIAKLRERDHKLSFEAAFRVAFNETVHKLSDADAYRAAGTFSFGLDRARNDLEQTFATLKEKDHIEIGEAIDLVRKYQPYQVYQDVLPLIQPLLLEEENRRYELKNDVLIKTTDGA